MRNLFLILVLAGAAGWLLVLVLAEEPASPTEADLEGVSAEASSGKEAAAEDRAREPMVVVVPKDRWNLVIEDDEIPRLDQDPRFARRKVVHDASGAEWYPTGREVLEILAQNARPDLRIKFQSSQDLEDFKKGKWKAAIPGVAHLHLYLETAGTVGFHPVRRADGVYMTRVTDYAEPDER